MNINPESPQQSSTSTILDYFLKWEKEMPQAIYLNQPRGDTWQTYRWAQVGEMARKIANTIQQLGITRGDRIAILSANCAEWIICDIAIMMGGYVSVPLYANVNPQTMQDILNHSESRLLFVGKLLPKDWEQQRMAIPGSLLPVCMDGYEKGSIKPWSQFIKSETPTAEILRPKLDEIQTIIYTSGTTGTPKGVVHTFRSIINAFHIAGKRALLTQRGNRFFSYLPLSHAAERGLVEFGSIYSGGSVFFVETQESFASNIKHAKPTHFLGVPRIWEKFQSKILEALPQRKLDTLLKIPIVSSIIKNKIRKSLGLDQVKLLLTGAAPISPSLIAWFQKLGFYLQEAYGMSENFNICTMNPRDQIRIGSVGKLYDGQEVVIDPQTHEIKQRCGWLMQGYYKDPEQTALTLRDGFLHTGDMGELSNDGFLKITGRVKDIFKTSKAEYIVPGIIEMKFLELNSVDQACVMGSKYPQPFIVVVLSTIGRSMKSEAVSASLLAVLKEYNQRCMEYQKIKTVVVVKEEWTPDNGLLTPTLKIKRNSLSAKYEDALSAHYHSNKAISWE